MLKKIVICIFVFVAALVPFSAFASTPIQPNGEINQGDFYFDQVYEKNHDIIEFVECTKLSDGRTKVNIRLLADMFVNNKFTIIVRLGVEPLDSEMLGAMFGSFTIITDMNLSIRKGLSEFYRYNQDSDGKVVYTQKADEVKETDNSYPTQDRIVVTYNTQPNERIPQYYMCAISLECLVSDYGYNLYFDNLNGFEIEDYNVYIADSLLDLEEKKAQSGGNSSLDGALGAFNGIDKSTGFFNALQRLASTMSYTGTASVWTVPSIKLPKIEGVMEEAVLTPDLSIDFRQTIRTYMPENIMKLVKALCTIALIGFCFKELYNIVQYVVSLKGGGSDE